jgi:glycosyltransferase involved in cell wall biosynthesis
LILVISPYLDKTYSGWSKQTKKLFNTNFLNNSEIVFIILKNEITKNFDNPNVKIKEININDISSFKNKVIFVISTTFYILKIRNRIKFIYLPNLYWFSLIFLCLTFFFNLNFIGRICANEIKNLNRNSYLKLTLLRKIKKIIILNYESFDILSKFNLFNTMFIPNSVDSDFYSFSKFYNNYFFLYVGEISRRKGLEVLIDNFIKLQNKYKFIKLELIGPISDLKFYNQLLLKINISNSNIKFLPPIYDEDLLKKYHESDIFILPSYSEGMPNVLLEAMSCGLVVVGSDIPGIIENITHLHNGFLFSHNNKNLYNILTNILDNKFNINLIKSNARKFIVSERSNTLIYNKISNLFN